MSETGVVKFRCEHVRIPLEKFAGFDDLNEFRRELLARSWIGADDNGIGFGNLSVRDGDSSRFFITGSGTSAKGELTLADYARVLDYDFEGNWVRCEGLTTASSESLTHAAIYERCSEARAVIHIHAVDLWIRPDLPSTSSDVEYGTTAMARAIARLFDETDFATRKVARMGGHAGGVIAFGRELEEASSALVSCS